jgi:hypothetical protein
MADPGKKQDEKLPEILANTVFIYKSQATGFTGTKKGLNPSYKR